MLSWLTDTLAKRLFLLLWAALVGSHVLAYAAVHLLYFGPQAPQRLPTFPSLPPTPGLPEPRLGPPPQAAPPRPAEPPLREPPGPRPGLPAEILLLDYGIRLLVIALAAWWGSRWLARPVRELVGAAEQLGSAVDGAARAPALDETQGTREVREAARVFNRMARELRRQFEERGLMMAAISHDLRTPLTRLRMRLETMEAPTEQRERSVADIREMNALIDQVLGLFRGSSEAPQDVDIAALAQALADDLAEQGQALHCQAEPGAVARAQPAALRRVLGNLLGNALRYGGGTVELEVRRVGAVVRVRIDDQGPGIPPAQLEAVFQPFFRLEDSRSRDTGGMGLGLFIARDLSRRMGASLSLSNRPEGGLRAELILPEAGGIQLSFPSR
jgi:signal transduction histidine kinase